MRDMIYRITPNTRQRAVARYLIEGAEQNMYGAMVKAGYSPASARNPSRLTQSRGWQQILDETLNDAMLSEVHTGLLKSKRLDHMVFPVYTGDDRDTTDADRDPNDRATLTDRDIIDMLSEVGGTVRRIVHGETARHVYFWTSNDKARQDALKLAYDLKGKLAKKDAPDGGDTYNTFIQQNNLNPNTPSAKQIVEASLDALMQQTKRKVVDP